MAPSNFNHLVLSQQAVFGSCTTPVLADGSVTANKIGTLASVVIQDITYTAASGGASGNQISITYIESTLPGQETVDVSGNAVTVNIGNPNLTILNILDATHFLLTSTAGIQVGDTIQQNIHSTTVSAILSTTEIQVVSTAGFTTGTALDNSLLSTATQVLTAVQDSYVASSLVTAVITGFPNNKQTGISETFCGGGQHGTVVSSIHADSNPDLIGDVQLVSGSNITLSQSGNSITINSSASSGVSSVNGLTGAVVLAAGTNISISPSGNTLTINNTATSAVWGNITGTIANQTDLQAEFATKQPVGTYITSLTGDVIAFGPGSAAATLSATAAVKSLHADLAIHLTGDVQLVSGTNVTLSQVGQAITINAVGGFSASNFVVGEIPSGLVNGVNTIFTLSNSPVVSPAVYLNGMRQLAGVGNDYTLSGSTITFVLAPEAGSVIQADYIK